MDETEICICKKRGRSPFDRLCSDQHRKRLIAAAVVEYFRWHLASDSVDLVRIQQNNGRMDGELAAEIARRYEVARNLRLGLENDKTLGKQKRECRRDQRRRRLVKELTKAAEDWPEGLVKRADVCRKLAKKLTGGTNPVASETGEPVSAVTKLMWFLRPERWTMFDTLASSALVLGSNAETSTRMQKFYQILNDRGFGTDCNEIQRSIDKSPFKSLHAPRVIDKVLFLCGMSEKARARKIEGNLIFMRHSLPDEMGKDLQNLSETIAEQTYPTLLQPGHLRKEA